MTRTASRLLLGAVLALALALRLRGIAFDLPFVYHPDEPFNVAIVQSIFKTGDLNPHWFVYPTLFYYIDALAYVPYYAAGWLAGTLHARSAIGPLIELAMGVTRATDPGVVLLSRTVSALFSVAAVALTYAVGVRLLASRAIGLLAAGALAINPTAVMHARYVTPDSFVIFFATAALLAAAFVYEHGRPRHYVVAGLVAGLAASTKYNAALVVIPLVAAHFLRPGNRGLGEPWLYVAGLCAAIGFVAGTPYAILDARNFLEFLRIDGRHYATGHPGMEGEPLRWYVTYMARTAAVLYALAALEIVRGVALRARPILVLAAFPVVYFLFIIGFEVRNDRTFMPMTPFLFLLAASLVVHAWHRAARLPEGARRRFAQVALGGVALAALAQPSTNAIAETAKLMHPDGRATARLWIAEHLPAGSRIALESYSPFVEPWRFDVVAVPRIIDRDPGWYAENGVRYLVFSAGMYRRYLDDPARYPGPFAKYERFFGGFPLLKTFDDGGYEIRIYEVARQGRPETARP